MSSVSSDAPALTPRRQPWGFALTAGLVFGLVFGTAFLAAQSWATLEQNGGGAADFVPAFVYAAGTLGPLVLAGALAIGLTAAVLPSVLYRVLARLPRGLAAFGFALSFAIVPSVALAWATTYPNPFWIVGAGIIALMIVLVVLAARRLFPRIRSSR